MTPAEISSPHFQRYFTILVMLLAIYVYTDPGLDLVTTTSLDLVSLLEHSQVVLTITLQPPFCHILTLKLLVSLFLKGLQMLDLESFWVSTSGIQMWLQQRGKHWISCSALTFEFAPALPINNMQGCLTLALLVGGHASHSSRWITVWICPKNYTSH